MKNIKQKVTIYTVSVILLCFIIVLISFNVMMERYIKNKAIKTIHQEMKEYIELYINMDNEYLDGADSAEAMQVDLIFTKSDKDNRFTKREERIIKYFKENPEKNGTVKYARIQNEDLYIARLSVEDGYVGYESKENEIQEEVILFYVNVTPLKLFSQSMNFVFLAILLICTLFSGYIGIKMGRSIENSEEKLKQFFQNVSHELKTPIMSIQGYAEGLQTGVIKNNEYATQIIIDESQKISNLVEELLYLSKIDSKQIVLREEPIAINEMLYDCLRSVEMIAMKREIEIKIYFNEGSPIIFGDEKQLSRAFTNIMVNALKYASSEVKIKCRRCKKCVEVIVEDDGKGISQKDLPYVFDRFYTGEKGNTGIGLALTKEIINTHGGTITAGNLEEGAIFKVVLKTSI